jgi:predicted nucleotide-binding protein (sugar kinase/HSP70/actin superfamily)
MKKRVGIPKGLFYFQYYPLWKTFFEKLNTEVIISDDTNKKILNDGVISCIDEACLPIKIFHGHVMNLKNKVDYLFIPRYTSISKKEYICPKFGGLPDMIRHTFADLPQIIDTEINLREPGANFIKPAIKIGRHFTDDTKRIKNAYILAITEQREFRKKIRRGGLTNELLKEYTQPKKSGKKAIISTPKEKSSLSIVLMGHCYNIYDSYANMNVVHKIKTLGANIITIDMLDEPIIHKKPGFLNKKPFWYFGTKVMESVCHLLEKGNIGNRNDIGGIIYIMSFGCGVDSFICDLAERVIRREKDIPFIALTIDEHTGEAGLNTRIEAFIDMIKRRNSNAGNFSPHGKPIHLH